MGREEPKPFDAEKDASNVVAELRQSFASGKTRSYDWRASQLQTIIKFIDNHQQDILHALRSDLSKSEMEAYIQEFPTPISRAFTSRGGNLRNSLSLEAFAIYVTFEEFHSSLAETALLKRHVCPLAEQTRSPFGPTTPIPSIVDFHIFLLYFGLARYIQTTTVSPPLSSAFEILKTKNSFFFFFTSDRGPNMAVEEEKKTEKEEVFDAEAASEIVKELRVGFGSGKTRSLEWRESQLQRLFKLLTDHEQDIVDALGSDLSKPPFESVIYEIGMLKNSCKGILKHLKRWMAPEKAKTSITIFPSSAEIVSEPLGVVLIISAWNYPLLLSLDPVVGAIAAGNAVVLKPSEVSPATSSLLAKLLTEYLDTSCVRVVEGAVAETTALLQQKWDKICYTGNGRVGRVVMEAAAKHLTPVLLELGGKSPVVVDSGINLQVATRRIIAGKWGCNNGQACISPDYIITTKDFAPKLVDSLKEELEKFYGKNQLESKDLSRIVNSNHFARLTKLLDDEKVSGKVIHGGERNETDLRIAPTILLDVPRDSLIMSEEIFGPLLPIITVDKIEESYDIINAGPKPLAAYLFTSNEQLKKQFVMTISAGGLVVNDTAIHLAVETLPFGGVGESGMGAYHGRFSFDAFSHKKAVVYRSFVGDAAIRYPPYTEGKLRLLKALLGGSLWGIIRALFGRS